VEARPALPNAQLDPILAKKVPDDDSADVEKGIHPESMCTVFCVFSLSCLLTLLRRLLLFLLFLVLHFMYSI
jgi:hypothetical protein